MIPPSALRNLYTFGSLRNTEEGVSISLKNRLSDFVVNRFLEVHIGPLDLHPDEFELDLGDGGWRQATEVTLERPEPFPLKKVAHLRAPGKHIEDGRHLIRVAVEVQGLGDIDIQVEDETGEAPPDPGRAALPCAKDDNASRDIVAARRAFVESFTGVDLHHVSQGSFDPAATRGNIENFTGVAQVPLGFAGPLRVNGEHAKGEFLIPLATTEGTLVASYNRGMKVLNQCGGVTCTVQADQMQRAPVFAFPSAREALAFRDWVDEHLDDLRREAEATTGTGRLSFIVTHLVSKFAYLRFNFRTGDAAGQNMVGRATYAACCWILEHCPVPIARFYLESNLASDKKASHINLLSTRGKRVTAECTVRREVLLEVAHAEPESLAYHWGVSNIGSMLAGSVNNGCHSPNAIAALFIATGQDVANLAESSSGILYVELTPTRDLYLSLTIPSLIVATHGGGTHLPTQKECLRVLGCLGAGRVRKFAEIVAGVALAGEISLGAAISSHEWVSSHEKYGRNR